jgi:hypothetical protein
MSKLVDFNFEQLSRIGNDQATYTQENIMNTNSSNYVLFNPFENKCNGGLDFATQQPNVFVNRSTRGIGPLGCNVQESSLLKKSELTNPNEKLTLHERPYKSIPFLGRGSVDVYEENKMRLGDTFKEKKSVSQLNEKPQFDVQQYPMQNELKKQYKTSKIETDVNPQWIRGGLDSRLLYQNIEYSKK